MSVDRPAAVACAAPHAPKASPRPASPSAGSVIAAVRVEMAKYPPPNPIKPAPRKKSAVEFIGAAKITVLNAATPASRPTDAMR